MLAEGVVPYGMNTALFSDYAGQAEDGLAARRGRAGQLG